jgi:predicted membrane protein
MLTNGARRAVHEANMDYRVTDTVAPPTFTDQDSFERGAALDELNLCFQSREFRGGTLTAVMSGVTVDLREAALSPEGATISLQSAFSDIDILVPRDWNVVCDVDAVFGGVNGERVPPSVGASGPHLRVTGMVVVGAVCVR